MLMEKPKSQIAAIVPTSATGMAALGMRVARNDPMNSQIVATTIVIVRVSDKRTSVTELRMNCA